MKLAGILLISILLYIVKDGMTMSFFIGAFLLYLLSFRLLLQYGGNQIQLQIHAHPCEGDSHKIRVAVELQNEGLLPILLGILHLRIENMITGACNQKKWIVSLGPKRKNEFLFYVEDVCCGGIRIQCENMMACDFLKIWKIRKPLQGEATGYIMPTLQELPISKEDVSRYDMESHKFSPHKKGNDSSETFGINLYQPGDNIKFIHWKLTGKMDELVIRELGLPIDNKLMILVDKSLLDRPALSGEKRSEATALAASLSYSFAKAGVHHQIGWFDQRGHEFVTYKVQHEEDVWSFIPHLLESPYDAQMEPVPVKFIEAETEKDFSYFIVVTNGDVDIERLMLYGDVNIYRPEDFQ